MDVWMTYDDGSPTSARRRRRGWRASPAITTPSDAATAPPRGRFLVETLQEVRKVWPENLPLTARFGVIEYDGRDEETLVEAIELTRKWRDEGLDFLNVSVGFSTMEAKVPWGPAFLAPIAARVRREVGIPVATAWGMDAPADAERAISENELDLAMVGRAHLADPHYTFRAARELKLPKSSSLLPEQYAYWLARYPGPQNGDPVD